MPYAFDLARLARNALPHSARSGATTPRCGGLPPAPPALLAGILSFGPARDLYHFGPLHIDDVGFCIGLLGRNCTMLQTDRTRLLFIEQPQQSCS